jgi:hypothetical protein
MKKQANHQAPKFRFLKPLIHMVFESRCIICQHQNVNNHVHHIDNVSTNNDPTNFVILCKAHHNLAHRQNFQITKRLSNQQALFLNEITNYVNSLTF